MTNVKRNIVIFVLCKIIESVAYAAATGTLIQVFLNSLGFSASQIYLHTTINQVVQIATILTCTKVGDRGNIFRRYSILVIIQGLIYLCYIPLCIHAKADFSAYMLLLGIGVLTSAASAMGGLIYYKLPYLIFRTEDYGAVTAVCGVIGSVIAIGMGVVMAALSAHFTYKVIMPWVFSIAALLILVAGLLRLWFRSLIDMKTVQDDGPRKRADFANAWQVIRQPMFYKMAIPNICRGFAGGMVGVIAVVAAADLHYSEQITTMLVSVNAAAQMIGYVFFGVLSRKLCPRYTVFISSLSFLCLPLMLIPGRPILFLCLAGVLTLGYTIEMETVPALLLRVVPGKIAGPYNAYRILLLNVGLVMATTLASILPSYVMLPAAMAVELVSSFCYGFLPLMRKAVPHRNC